MDHIKEAILNYADMSSSGAMLISGLWGTGKTYYIKNRLIEDLKSKGKRPIHVSLFGHDNIESIQESVTIKYLQEADDNIKTKALVKAQRTFKKISGALKFSSKANEVVDFSGLFNKVGNLLVQGVEFENAVIFFDDFERLSDKINQEEVLGFINNLTENRGLKVVLVANLEGDSATPYKEKVIEKTLVYRPNFEEILDTLFKCYEKKNFAFFEYLKSTKLFIQDSLSKNINGNDQKNRFNNALSNLRIVKFAIEHFQISFNLINDDQELDETKKNQLNNIWVFTLGLSVLVKVADGVDQTHKESLKDYDPFFDPEEMDFDMKDFSIIEPNQAINTEEAPPNFQGIFRQHFHDRLNQKYIFYSEIFDFITEGKSIKHSEFKNELDKKFYIKDGHTKPPHALLNSLIHNVYTFTNDGYINGLVELHQFTKSGELDDLSSYLNAANILLRDGSIIGLQEAATIEDVKTGIRIAFEKIQPKSYPLFIGRRDVLDRVPKSESHKSVLSFIYELIDSKANKEKEEIKSSMKKSFQNNMTEFQSVLADRGEFQANDNSAFLHEFTKDDIEVALKNMEPSDVEILLDFIKARFGKNIFLTKTKTEKEFLLRLQNVIGELENDSLSRKLLKLELLPIVKKSIELVENFFPESTDDKISENH